MIKKILYIFLSIILIFGFFLQNTTVQASSLSGIVSGADDFISTGEGSSENPINPSTLHSTADLIYNTLLIIGTCVAVIIAAVLGIQFITGSVEQKVKVKESLLPFVAGCVVIFGAFGIWKLVILILN